MIGPSVEDDSGSGGGGGCRPSGLRASRCRAGRRRQVSTQPGEQNSTTEPRTSWAISSAVSCVRGRPQMGSSEASGPQWAIWMLDAGTGFSTPRSVTWVSDTATPQLGRWVHDRRAGQRLTRRCQVAEPRRHVHAVPHVVVALHQDHLAALTPERMETVPTGPETTPTTKCSSRIVSSRGRVSHAHQHHAVTQPLGNPHPSTGADVAQQRAERRQHVDGPLVPLELRQRGESRHVDKGETAVDAHGAMLPWGLPRGPIERPSPGSESLVEGCTLPLR